jgi:hypothetical protein
MTRISFSRRGMTIWALFYPLRFAQPHAWAAAVLVDELDIAPER